MRFSSSLKEHPSLKESMNSRQQQLNSCEEQQEGGVGSLGHFFSGFPDLNPVFSSSLGQQQQLQMAELNAIVNVKQSSPGSPQSLSSIMGNRALSGLVQKIGHLQMLVQLVGEGRSGNQQQHVATAAGIGRLIDQLLVAAKGILVEQQQVVQQHHLLDSSSQFSAAATAAGLFQEGILGACSGNNNNNNSSSSSFVGDFIGDDMGSFQQMPFHGILPKTEDEEQLPWYPIVAAAKHEDGDDEATEPVENLPRGAYDLIELDAMEIMAEHTHFCDICGKGFKRDANLRMHMRGHGDEYKTAAALARPKRSMQDQQQQQQQPPKRYSCPYAGCKRNKHHRKFVPLKTMLCVKNHYRRSHCPKRLACTKCRVKRFAVLADLKTHEKHCGREKWQCSCGTTFSRKDKLLGHVALFLGHKPLVMLVPPPPPVLLPPGGGDSAAAYAQNGHLPMQRGSNAFLAAQQYAMANFDAAAGNISNNSCSTVMLGNGGGGGGGGGSQLSSGTGSSTALTTTGTDATTTVESCWSPSIFTTANHNNNQQQESNSSSSSLGFVGLDFFDCKSS